ncbi:MAG TPA: hypothetical protein VM077_05175 [Candidatus Limnocylindrales bacterium]|nr:hypothetical protein [Candidatus Limnocylindrales bacterium]
MKEWKFVRNVTLTAALTIGVGVADTTTGTKINKAGREIAAPLRKADFPLSLYLPNNPASSNEGTIITTQDFSTPWALRIVESAKAEMAQKGMSTRALDNIEKSLSSKNPNVAKVRRDIDKAADSLEKKGKGQERRGKALGIVGGIIFIAAATKEEENKINPSN